MTKTIRVGIVDDHPIFLAGLQHALKANNGISVVAEGHSMDDAVTIAAKTSPDVMLLDINMPGGGIEAARCIAAHHPSIRIIMLSGADDQIWVSRSIGAGALGYVVKGASKAEICEAIRTVDVGEEYMSVRLATRFALQFLREGPRPGDGDEGPGELNARETQVFKFASDGLSNKEIAAKLDLSVSTVKSNMSQILRKLNSRNRIEAFKKCEKGV
ncbi:MAG: response regulator transcription factor [Hyphomicrobium sp.]